MVRRILQWVADSLRLVGAAFYWNTRKSVFRLRGRRGRCPCQNESDDSIPGRVRCDAMLHWHDPTRFRKICPLLIETSEGWRCSVHASEVRPFWRRVLAWTALSFVSLYPVGVLGVFLFFRFVSGAPITLGQVLWPSRWSEIRRVQSEQFLAGAAQALAAGRYSEAYLSLSSARERDPSNYPAALLLAKLAMFQGSALFADEQFARILAEHPLERHNTAIFFHDTLVQADRMEKLGEFSLKTAVSDAGHAGLWVRSVLLALRSMPTADALALQKQHADWIAKLAPHARLLVEAELALRAGHKAEAIKGLGSPFAGPVNSFYTSYQIMRCAELGAMSRAQVLLDLFGPTIGEFDSVLLQFRLARIAGDRPGADLALRRLLALDLNELRVERLAAALILHPDEAQFRSFARRVQRDSRLEALSDGSGLWLAALICGDRESATYWMSHGKPGPHAGLTKLPRVDFTVRDPRAETSPLRLLNALVLPREVIDALLLRTDPQVRVEKAEDPRLR